jgi:hypothetical protein
MASKLPVRLPTFDKRIIDDLALLVKLSAENLKPIAEVAVQLIVSNAGDGEIAELAGDGGCFSNKKACKCFSKIRC